MKERSFSLSIQYCILAKHRPALYSYCKLAGIVSRVACSTREFSSLILMLSIQQLIISTAQLVVVNTSQKFTTTVYYIICSAYCNMADEEEVVALVLRDEPMFQVPEGSDLHWINTCLGRSPTSVVDANWHHFLEHVENIGVTCSDDMYWLGEGGHYKPPEGEYANFIGMRMQKVFHSCKEWKAKEEARNILHSKRDELASIPKHWLPSTFALSKVKEFSDRMDWNKLEAKQFVNSGESIIFFFPTITTSLLYI